MSPRVDETFVGRLNVLSVVAVAADRDNAALVAPPLEGIGRGFGFPSRQPGSRWPVAALDRPSPDSLLGWTMQPTSCSLQHHTPFSPNSRLRLRVMALVQHNRAAS